MNIFKTKSFIVLLFFASLAAFSQEQTQYPDTIVDSYNSTSRSRDIFYGGSPGKNNVIVSLNVLLEHNNKFVSLPKGSFVIVGFKDNYIIDAPNQNDIFIEEVGGAGEFADIFVSSDNVEYVFLGVAGNGSVNEFDLAKINYKKQVKYIKIVGIDSKGASPGFDIGNLYALPGANKTKYDEPIILENVLFKTNESILLEKSFVSLNKLYEQLQKNTAVAIQILGHTDNVGNQDKNQTLSEERAKAVMDYLVSKGIDANRLSFKGFGSSAPIASNDDEEGRTKTAG